jgi:hypothetical protein
MSRLGSGAAEQLIDDELTGVDIRILSLMRASGGSAPRYNA